MLRLAGPQGDVPPSVKALAEFQGIPSAYLSKIMTQLEKAGLVVASEGKRGGYRLARPPAQISFLDVADAIEGSKRLFECTEIRRRCVLYGDAPPKAAVSGICAIHAAMLAAERRMRDHLAKTTRGYRTFRRSENSARIVGGNTALVR
jgi:Rrf2 family protein